jgi:YD repeat-containing protein
MDLEFKYDLDSEYKFKFITQLTESTPSLLERVTLKDKTYNDTDSDDIPDLITQTVSVNGKMTTLENNVLQLQKAITSPEGRTITMLYNPNTLVNQSVSVPNLFDTSYEYDSKGRLISVETNTRGIAYTYNNKSFLESVTDPENHTTIYGYDEVGRVTSIDRPDGSSLGFAYPIFSMFSRKNSKNIRF